MSGLTGRGALKIHPRLLEVPNTAADRDLVPIALMRHDGQRQEVCRRGWGRHKHGVQGVLAVLAVEIPEALDAASEDLVLKHDVVVELLGNSSAAHHT